MLSLQSVFRHGANIPENSEGDCQGRPGPPSQNSLLHQLSVPPSPSQPPPAVGLEPSRIDGTVDHSLMLPFAFQRSAA